MNIQSGASGHWTDEQLIRSLYGLGPDDGHLQHCRECEKRLAILRQNRSVTEKAAEQAEPDVSFVAAQRRRIYARLAQEQQQSGSLWLRLPRWASATALLLAVGGALFLAEDGSWSEDHRQDAKADKAAAISDSQLAVEVSELAGSPEPAPTQPLQALFAD